MPIGRRHLFRVCSGYLHPEYAASFSEFGRVRALPLSGGFVIERAIPNSSLRDAMGCYPLFACRDWKALSDDIRTLHGDLVSLTLVADPLGDFDERVLHDSFDIVLLYKKHLVTDLAREDEMALGGHHRRNIKKARSSVRVEVCDDPLAHLDEWISLFDVLVSRHDIRGIQAFSPAAFTRQLAVPGLVMFRGTVDGECVGLHLWYVSGDIAYAHLGATSLLGYNVMASYALYDEAVRHFRDRVRWLDLGAAPDEGGESLLAFKRGWSTGVQPAYLCGAILQPEWYAGLTRSHRNSDRGFFPAYRARP